MPRGKELEQLPMANTLPGAGRDKSQFRRERIAGIVSNAEPQPGEITKEIKT
ncbi:hypothetical protein [Neobacillus sp. Marseille-QA0830]